MAENKISHNKMAEVAALFGTKLGVEFEYASITKRTFKFTTEGVVMWDPIISRWITANNMLIRFLTEDIPIANNVELACIESLTGKKRVKSWEE